MLLGQYYLQVPSILKLHTLIVLLVQETIHVWRFLTHQHQHRLRHLHVHHRLHQQEHQREHQFQHQQELQLRLLHQHNLIVSLQLVLLTKTQHVVEVPLKFMLMELWRLHGQHSQSRVLVLIQLTFTRVIRLLCTLNLYLWVVQVVRFMVLVVVQVHLMVLLKWRQSIQVRILILTQWIVQTTQCISSSNLIRFNENNNLKYKTPSNRGFSL